MKHSGDLPSSPWAEANHLQISQWWTEYASSSHIDRLPAASVRNLFVRSELPTEMLAHVSFVLPATSYHLSVQLLLQIWEVSKVWYRDCEDTDHVSLVRIEFEVAMLALSLSQSGLTPSPEVLHVALEDTSIAMPGFSALPYAHDYEQVQRPPHAHCVGPSTLVSPIVSALSSSPSAGHAPTPHQGQQAHRERSASMPQLGSAAAVEMLSDRQQRPETATAAPAASGGPTGGHSGPQHIHGVAPFAPWDPFGSQAGVAAPIDTGVDADPFASLAGVQPADSIGAQQGGAAAPHEIDTPAANTADLLAVAALPPAGSARNAECSLVAQSSCCSAPCSLCLAMNKPATDMGLEEIVCAKNQLWMRLQELVGREYHLQHT